MKVEYINPFIAAVNNIFPQLGFNDVKKKDISIIKDNKERTGIVMMLGLVGDVEGNVAYYLSFENAKKIAAQMMMVEELTELDNMAKSALSELSNMLTANASINFAQNDLEVDISPPTTMFGEKFKCEMNSDKIIAIKMEIDGILLELNISLL